MRNKTQDIETTLGLTPLSIFISAFSPDVTPDTTADGAAGIFGLYLMGDTPTADQVLFVFKKQPLKTNFQHTKTTTATFVLALSKLKFQTAQF